jgi:16S rRNA (guanine966-N2)-methyltransferase
MRIIAGTLGGRQFNSPHGHRTHPMSEKGRGALFNALGDINGLTVIDAFAGSGALSFEAISRGAASALAIDSDRNAQRAIGESITALGLSRQVKLIKATAGAWLSTSDDTFDLVLLDPPYDKLQPQLLAKLAARAKPGGTVVLSLPPHSSVDVPPELRLINQKDYGDAQLSFYKKT